VERDRRKGHRCRMNRQTQQFRDVLGSRGLKNSKGREKILKKRKLLKGHVTAEEL
jgi:hypothetical protein